MHCSGRRNLDLGASNSKWKELSILPLWRSYALRKITYQRSGLQSVFFLLFSIASRLACLPDFHSGQPPQTPHRRYSLSTSPLCVSGCSLLDSLRRWSPPEFESSITCDGISTNVLPPGDTSPRTLCITSTYVILHWNGWTGEYKFTGKYGQLGTGSSAKWLAEEREQQRRRDELLAELESRAFDIEQPE